MDPIKTYATALFSVGEERDKTQDYLWEFKAIIRLMDVHSSFVLFLNHPTVSKEIKKNVIKSALYQKISQEMVNFIFLVIDKNRQNSLKEIFREYSNLYRKSKSLRYAKVFTVVALDEDEKIRLKSKLDQRFATDVLVENIIDESVLGGMVIRMGFTVIDASLKGELDRLRNVML